MSNLAFSLDRLQPLDLSKDRAVVLGAVSDRTVEIMPSDHTTAADTLFDAFDGAVLLRDGGVDLVDPLIEAARKVSREEHIFLTCDETLKTVDNGEKLARKLTRNPSSSVVVIGSGSLINLATYAIADMNPALKLTVIPTNAMSVADVAYGGLGLINGAKKNDIRKFRDPDLIFLSRALFCAAPLAAQTDGQIEVVKHLIFQDTGENSAQIRLLLDPHTIPPANELFKSATLGLKLNITLRHAVNSGEQSAALILNFGHAHAHAIETLSNYRVAHSEAVRFGMAVDCAGAQEDLCSLLKESAPWSAPLIQALRHLLERNDAGFADAYQRKYVSDRDIICIAPERKPFPYTVRTCHVKISHLREKIRGLLV